MVTKDDIIDLLIKSAGLIFIILVILTIPALIMSLVSLSIIGLMKAEIVQPSQGLISISSMMVNPGVGVILKFIICVGSARYFFKNPKMIRNWMTKKKDLEQ